MIKLLIVDDSPVAQEFLKHIFSSDPEIEVVGIAHNGREAIECTAAQRPNVITMDLHMPILDGLGATRKIMETCATPIVIVSGNPDVREAALSFQLLDAGALAVVVRPPSIGDPDYQRASRNLIETVKCLSEIRMVSRPCRRSAVPSTKNVGTSGPETRRREGDDRRFSGGEKNRTMVFETWRSDDDLLSAEASAQDIRLVAIGASTGGPQALQRILSALPKDVPVPILIVQHIALGFVGGFAEWLTMVTGFPVHLASDGERPLPGHVYIPPDGVHLGISNGPQIVLSHQPPEENLRPAVSHLFRTVARAMGSQAVGVLLTGMGRDGARELKLMKEAGAMTLAQDKASSVVFGMPGEAISLGAATHILPPEGIAAFLITLLKKKREQ